ncbi:hypothetical protein CGH55_04965, partial [Vibrio parahaemolyticus]
MNCDRYKRFALFSHEQVFADNKRAFNSVAKCPNATSLSEIGLKTYLVHTKYEHHSKVAFTY